MTRDTPLGGCHVTSRCPATPTVTRRDIVTPCHAVTQWLFMESKAAATRFFWPHAAGAGRALLVLGVLNQHREVA